MQIVSRFLVCLLKVWPCKTDSIDYTDDQRIKKIVLSATNKAFDMHSNDIQTQQCVWAGIVLAEIASKSIVIF